MNKCIVYCKKIIGILRDVNELEWYVGIIEIDLC